MSHIRMVVDALPPNVRLGIYAAVEAVGYALAAAEAALLVAGHHWLPLTIALTVYGVLSGRTHALARANVNRTSARVNMSNGSGYYTPKRPPRPQP